MMMVNGTGVSKEEALQSMRDYRQAASPGTATWVNATVGLGQLLQRDGRHREARSLFDQALKAMPTDISILLDAAESSFALGDKEAARKRIGEAEAGLSKTSLRQEDVEAVKPIRDRIAKLREQLDHHPGQ
jgi:hypothetical protein